MGTTTTAAEIHATITAALATQARDCRKAASGHRNAGPHMAGVRAALRAEAKRCEDLQRILAQVAPEALAAVLEARPVIADSEATSEERLLLAVHAVDPDNPANVRELRTHEAECTESDYMPCLAHLAEQSGA